MKETILLYNIVQQELLDIYQGLCDEQGIALHFISPREYSVPIGFLAFGTDEQKAEYITEEATETSKSSNTPDASGTSKSSNTPDASGTSETSDLSENRFRDFGEPMMVFAGFTGPRLTEILTKFREIKVPGISLKAMMTEHNAVWDSRTLFEQLAEERDQFARMKQM